MPDRQKVQPCRTDENETVWEQLQTFVFSRAEKMHFRKKNDFLFVLLLLVYKIHTHDYVFNQ